MTIATSPPADFDAIKARQRHLVVRRLRRHRHHAPDHRRAALRSGRPRAPASACWTSPPATATPRSPPLAAAPRHRHRLRPRAARPGRGTRAAEGLTIEVREADAEALPFDDAASTPCSPRSA